ncbi:MAG: PBP1A family penicillin-binding protein [Candidatus Pacebacteria bacterium]|jgi:1A family penicillin-binding protein|nr:PBP1A family penicillin-binding protein [Candidatus Paceibacterota bacterium]MBT4359247.1 PBP1A family penicillin-binding protein [Candidatus Paceibacterota bacterium]MBT7309634.1 PBP1A family penicillin-binding protein [Candidatus Paceibacterota bacterium]
MRKKDPIASKNRTYLFIKNTFKLRLVRSLYFAYFFNELKKPGLISLNKARKSALKQKYLFKKIGQIYLWMNPISKKIEKKLVHKKSKKTTNSLLLGWSITNLFPFELKLPKISLEIPKIAIKLPKIKISASVRSIVIGLIAVTIFGAGYNTYLFIFKDLPKTSQLIQDDQIVTTRILSRDSEVLFKIYEDENRTLVKLSDIPQHLIDATIATEDKNFYYHRGFSIQGIIRAAIANRQDNSIQQGGSTITQQLVKNRLLSRERTIQRKLRELVLSISVEFKFSKDDILEMYFNQVPYGGSAYGVEEAAQRYFGKNVTQLNLAESTMLAGLPAAPSVYSPFAVPELAKRRQKEVLQRMVDDEYLDQTQADAAYNQSLNFQHDSIDIIAPHFVFYIKQLLAQQYGEAAINQGGLEVTTTLNLELQQAAQKIVTDEVNKLKPLRVNNGAALVTNPKTGEILAMVGSKDYFDFEHDGQVNVTLRSRQPGSSIKPLTYAIALENGKSPSSIIDDSPITYRSLGSPPYSPKNYDGKFHGKVTLRESLASSYNVPAVKTLAEIGVSNMLDKAELMGIDTWQDRSRFGLSLTLGGGEVKMTDMAELYSSFANQGKTTSLNPILEIKNYKGEILYRNTCVLDNKGCPQNKTLSPKVAYQISDILSDNQARTPAFGPRSVLHIPNQQVAVKTGTTNNLRDNWTIGYTTDYLTAVWVGNNDNLPMSYVASGITGASPIWNNIMRLLLDEDNPHTFPTPAGLIKVKICATTGTLPCAKCPVIKEELFVPGTEPQKACSPNWFNKKETNDEKK